MKKFITAVAFLGLCTWANAAHISHTDYTAGSVITSAGQNTNENTIVNEINGNLDSTNIAVNGLGLTNIPDGLITFAKLNSVLQSSFTNTNNLQSYRRPVLKWVSSSQVIVETGTLGDTNAYVMFPDGTVRGDNATARIQLTVSQTAVLSGTAQSGLRVGTVVANTWYAVYAVKTTDNASHFVAVADTVLPISTNYATLNSNFGQNGWTYLGTIRSGNNANSSTSILQFAQTGNMTLFQTPTSGETANGMGVFLSSAAATTTAFTYLTGTAGKTLPDMFTTVYYQGCASNGGTAPTVLIRDSSNSQTFVISGVPIVGTTCALAPMPASAGFTIGSNVAYTIGFLYGWHDNALGIASNPLF